MMIGERNVDRPTVHVPPWPFTPDDSTSFSLSPSATAGGNDDYSVYPALHRYLPSNSAAEGDFPADAHSCDQFRMYEFKVKKCTRGKSHDWTECPYAHPGEKARRRDPRRFHYSGAACPEFRKGNCRKGDACEYAHGVFECWLHPARYRTQPCKDGLNCRRRVCFFAHSPDQLRVLSPRAESYDGYPPAESPPVTPSSAAVNRSLGSNSINEMIASLRQLQLNRVKSIPPSWSLQAGTGLSPTGSVGSPRLPMTRPGYFSLPSTPTKTVSGSSFRYPEEDEEASMERAESGRDLRAQMFEKLSKENPLACRDDMKWNPVQTPAEDPNPDIGWVSEMLN